MIRKIFHLFLFFSLITFFLSGCGIYKRSDVKDNPVNVKERVEKITTNEINPIDDWEKSKYSLKCDEGNNITNTTNCYLASSFYFV